MSFQPFVPFAGYAGWTFLNRTMADQQAAFTAAPVRERDMQYFREQIGSVQSAEDLVGDYRLLQVALGAFGLQEDLPNRGFIRTVLEEGVTADDALSNRLADKRYRALSDAFGFGESLPPKTSQVGFADKILARFERQEFERAIGEENNDMRLALTAARELPELADRDITSDAAWLSVLGNPPLRQVFEVALGLPTAIAGLDLDQQLENFRDRANRVLGSSDLKQFSDPGQIDELMKSFLTRAQIADFNAALSPASVALTLLQGAG